MQELNPKRDTLEAVEKIILFVIVTSTIISLFFVYHYLDAWRTTNVETHQAPQELLTSGALACVELGCTPGTNFIGSKLGDVYHKCESSYARSILPENRLCFSSASDAVAQGYRAAKN